MKQTRILFFAAMATSSFCMKSSCLLESDSKCHNCKPTLQKPSDSGQTGKVVIASFLAMFANFLNMVTNPRDKEALVQGSMGIAQSLATIATEACKCVELDQVSAEEMLTYVTTECAKANVDAELTKSLTRAIKDEFYKSTHLSDATRAYYKNYSE
ncbi:MAG: hypothetical protein K2X90_01085 [Candidatus Babeliaceae bacterium]|nr:hypothetical protein [Candidatus Babeliaceae bacterium]